jgi:hypothetical protein
LTFINWIRLFFFYFAKMLWNSMRLNYWNSLFDIFHFSKIFKFVESRVWILNWIFLFENFRLRIIINGRRLLFFKCNKILIIIFFCSCYRLYDWVIVTWNFFWMLNRFQFSYKLTACTMRIRLKFQKWAVLYFICSRKIMSSIWIPMRAKILYF